MQFAESIQADELRSAVRGKFDQVNVQQVGDEQANEYLIRIENPKEGTESVQGDIDIGMLEPQMQSAFADG